MWAMPDGETFSIRPIAKFVHKYMHSNKISIDPFARNSNMATYTNDLNPKTNAKYHEDVWLFLKRLKSMKVTADLVLFDPPYSLRQMKEIYNGIGIDKLSMGDTQRLGSWTKERDAIADIISDQGIVLSFGWNSNGMGKGRGFEIIEIMLVSHGGAHNDTICIAEKKVKGLFDGDRL
jgi:hypothetical protein